MQSLIGTCSTDYITYAYEELKKADPTITGRKALDAGVFLTQTDLSFSQVSEKVQRLEPIFLRHIQPVDEVIEINRSKDDILHLIDLLLAHINRFQPGDKIAIQVRRTGGLDYSYTTYGVKEALDPFLQENQLVPVIQNPNWVISIYLTSNQAYFGISAPSENLSSWPGGAVRFQKTDQQASRSRFKLEEACLEFDIDLTQYKEALDLGAAPGGWTSFLLDQGLEVTAVDTGKFDPHLLENPNLKFINKNAAEVRFPEESFDVITCDMSWDPFHSARIVKSHSDSLRPDGILIFTVKLLHKKIRKTIEECLDIFEPEFELIRVKHLFHNRDEVTVYLRKS